MSALSFSRRNSLWGGDNLIPSVQRRAVGLGSYLPAPQQEVGAPI